MSTDTIPVYRYRQAGPQLMTRRQLRAVGLRPGGQDPVAEIQWRRGRRVAYLYDPARALPVRPMTPARARAVAAMLTARRTCPECRRIQPYCLPRSLGTCLPCADTMEVAA
ncbi:RRQRL motif-containing zinc-binding protein [Enterococcus casseliflavus]|uniref:RRQRL motif-containing zinc-binding protein n=1 Tax=Enterococcus casseliflavus TaxID=37734 RepID=UPI0037AFC62C